MFKLMIALVLLPLLSLPLSAQNPPAEAGNQQPAGGARGRAPRPYDQVITARAATERGALTVHKVDDRYFFEVGDAVLGRDWLLVSRLSGVPAGSGGITSTANGIVPSICTTFGGAAAHGRSVTAA